VWASAAPRSSQHRPLRLRGSRQVVATLSQGGRHAGTQAIELSPDVGVRRPVTNPTRMRQWLQRERVRCSPVEVKNEAARPGPQGGHAPPAGACAQYDQAKTVAAGAVDNHSATAGRLRLEHVHLDAVPPHIEVWRSVRADGDTKTRTSRRTLALPARCVEALRKQRAQQLADRLRAGDRWQENGLAFATSVGTKMSAGNVRRDFRRALALVPGIDPSIWTPRELRHSFLSVLSDAGVPLEEISQLVGHSGTTVTELVYRHTSSSR
jgi:hypothetical protein